MFWILPLTVICLGGAALLSRKSKAEKEREQKLEEMVNALGTMKKEFEMHGKEEFSKRCDDLLKFADSEEDAIIRDIADNKFGEFKVKFDAIKAKYITL